MKRTFFEKKYKTYYMRWHVTFTLPFFDLAKSQWPNQSTPIQNQHSRASGGPSKFFPGRDLRKFNILIRWQNNQMIIFGHFGKNGSPLKMMKMWLWWGWPSGKMIKNPNIFSIYCRYSYGKGWICKSVQICAKTDRFQHFLQLPSATFCTNLSSKKWWCKTKKPFENLA